MSRFIINSLIDNDLYKFSMGQVALHRFPKETAKAEFKCRSDVKLGELKPLVDAELDHLCQLRFAPSELGFLRAIPWLSSDYVDYLERFYLKREQIKTGVDGEDQLTVTVEGPWRDMMFFEIPVLAIISELHMAKQAAERPDVDTRAEGEARLSKFIDSLNKCFIDQRRLTGKAVPFTLADFGVRRRFSGEWQDRVIQRLKSELAPGMFTGTSSVLLAQKHGVKPIGTMAHEYFQILQCCDNRLSEAQKRALEVWAQEYRGELGIALSDIFGFRAFLRDFDKYFAKLFDGCRHDSGNPFKWGEMLIAHYEKLGIDPKTKVGVWSDSLDAETACAIATQFCGRIGVSFGIGTKLTNNVGLEPLNMVLKLTEANGLPCAKLSDAPGKQMCRDKQFVDYLKQVYHYKSIDED